MRRSLIPMARNVTQDSFWTMVSSYETMMQMKYPSKFTITQRTSFLNTRKKWFKTQLTTKSSEFQLTLEKTRCKSFSLGLDLLSSMRTTLFLLIMKHELRKINKITIKMKREELMQTEVSKVRIYLDSLLEMKRRAYLEWKLNVRSFWKDTLLH